MSKKTEAETIKEYLARIGSKGGKVSRGGGRPRIPDDELTEAQRKRRERYERKKKENERM